MAPLLAAALASMLLMLSTASFQRSFPVRRVTQTSLFSVLSENLVSSTKSNTVKKIQALLGKRKKRVELSQTIVEGPRMVFDLLADHSTRGLVKQVLISTDKWEDYQTAWHAALDQAGDSENDDGKDAFPPTVVPGTPEVLKACTDTVTNQGIIAIVDIPSYSLLEPTTASSPAAAPLYLVLDGVADPGNLGTLLRSSVATGTAAVILLPGSCDPWNPKAVRSAMGASFRLPVVAVDSWDACRDLLSNLQCHRTYAATMLDDVAGTSHYEVDWTAEPTALIIGSEGNGLSDEVRQALRSDGESIRPVYVPMQAGIESLNAAVCGSVILFEYLRRRQILPVLL